jgi:hypothetical protein
LPGTGRFPGLDVSMSYVPPLVIAAAGAVPPPAPAPDRPGVNVWRNKRGGIVATGFTEGGVHWMHWPYLAAYRFAPGEPSITAYPAANAPLDVLEDTYRRSVVPMALQALGYEALHSSASLTPSGVVGFFAASETGKSTIAYGLSERGFPQWGDDSLLFEPAARPFVSRRLPFDIRLRPRSRAFFDANTMRDEAEAIALPESAPVAALCLLTRGERPVAAPVDVCRLNPVRAFSWLIAHAHCFNPHDDARRATMLKHYLDLTALVPVYEVTFLASLDVLPLVLDGIVGALADVTDRPAAQSQGAAR